MSGALLLVAILGLSLYPSCSPSPSPLHVSAGAPSGTALYRAPSAYREPGRPARNSVIITSQPVRIGQQLNLDGAPGAGGAAAADAVQPPSMSEGSVTPATWRRQLFVRTTLGTDGALWMPSVHVSSSSTAVQSVQALGVGGVGGDSGGTPVVAIDCADGKSCSTTIPVRPPAATHSPTFKPYSQEVLDKFLSDYATVTTAGNGTDPISGGKELLLQLQQQQQRQQQQQQQYGETLSSQATSPDGVEIEPTNRLANLYLEDGVDGAENITDSSDDKSKSVQWSHLKTQHHKHPYDDHKGWVTLEPVPWSSSHVSKWQSNVQAGRPGPGVPGPGPGPVGPWDSSPSPSSWHNDIDQRPGPPSPPHHGPNGGYQHGPSQNFNGNGNWPSGGGGSGSGGPSRPPSSWSEGPGGWDRDRPVPGQDYRPERPGPGRPSSWDAQRPNKWDRPGQVNQVNQGPEPGQWVNSADPDIITDNSPPDFPAHNAHPGHSQQGPRPGASYTYGPSSASSVRPWGSDPHGPHREPGRHPATHPEEGDGTWVLLSSTKGYSTPPRGRLPHQRALTVSTHRSVRLTVLPPDPANGTNMTTSHGGLLEVEDTQHTVDESQRLHAASQSSLLKQALDQHHNATLSSYESLVREATRAHEAQLLKQALADHRLANATALSPELLQHADKRADKRADNVSAPPAPAALAAPAAPVVRVPTKTKSSKSRTRIRLEPVPPPLPALRGGNDADLAGFSGRGEGSTGSAMAVKVVRPATPSRRSMALAAVGAGLLPATMAMLVPIMLGRRRRSVRSLEDEAQAKAETVPSYLAYAPYAQDQPLEVEDSPPRVIDFVPSSSSSWARPRRRRDAHTTRI